MSNRQGQKVDNPQCVPQVALVRITRTPGELAQLELVEQVYGLQLRGRRPRRFRRIAANEIRPLTGLDKLTEDAVRARVSEEAWIAAVLPVVRGLIRRRFSRARFTTTGNAA